MTQNKSTGSDGQEQFGVYKRLILYQLDEVKDAVTACSGDVRDLRDRIVKIETTLTEMRGHIEAIENGGPRKGSRDPEPAPPPQSWIAIAGKILAERFPYVIIVFLLVVIVLLVLGWPEKGKP